MVRFGLCQAARSLELFQPLCLFLVCNLVESLRYVIIAFSNVRESFHIFHFFFWLGNITWSQNKRRSFQLVLLLPRDGSDSGSNAWSFPVSCYQGILEDLFVLLKPALIWNRGLQMLACRLTLACCQFLWMKFYRNSHIHSCILSTSAYMI